LKKEVNQHSEDAKRHVQDTDRVTSYNENAYPTKFQVKVDTNVKKDKPHPIIRKKKNKE
jgi:hypothetical protein